MADVILEDEALRDGLQFESIVLPVEQKLEIIKLLTNAGVRRIQVGSFVHPKWVPQMADTDKLIPLVPKTPGLLLTGLILNDKGLERAQKCSLKHVSMSVSLSDTHSRKNANIPADKALEKMTGLISQAVGAGMVVRAGLQCAFGCVYEGNIGEHRVLSAMEKMAAAGASEINLADTTGMANPKQIKSLIATARKNFPEQALSLHLHDTRGLGLANMFAGYEAGVRLFDVAAGGLGGCPFVKDAGGNIPTEDAVHLFEAMGVATGIDLNAFCRVVRFLEEILGRRLPGRMTRVLESLNI